MKKIALKFVITIAFLCSSFLMAYSQQTAEELWKDYKPKKGFKVEVLKKWENDKGNFEYVRYNLGKLKGTNKSASPMIAAYYGYPKGAKNVPAIVQIHGGGQRANLSRIETWLKLGYACISINWGGKELEKDLPNTDWDGIAAGFIGRAEGLIHYNDVTPGKNTLYKEPHGFNSSWNLIAMSAKRAITFLEKRKEVDANRIGVEGHSMGGRSTVLTAIDPRIKAAAPSVGGSGYLYQDIWGLPNSRRGMRANLELYEATVAAQAYWPNIKTPILFLGATNDFNSPTENIIKGMSLLPKETENILVLSPHLNHRFTAQTDAARFLWMEAHVKGNFTYPKKSPSQLKLKTKNGIPVLTVTPDESAGLPIEKVEIFYGYSRDPRNRFWHSAIVKKNGKVYEGECPVFDAEEPLFAFANITYKLDRIIPAHPGKAATDKFTVSSEYQIAYPEQLKTAKVKATERRHVLIDDFANGMQDWYMLSANNNQHWFYATRKLMDPCFMGPKGGKLSVDIKTNEANNLVAIGIEVNTWQNYTGRGKDNYYALVELPNNGLNKVEISLSDFKNKIGKTLKDWDEVTELSLTPSWKVDKTKPKNNWNGKAPELVAMKWVGGDYSKWRRIYPHEKRGDASVQKALNFDNEFQDAIKQSVLLEQQDESNKQ